MKIDYIRVELQPALSGDDYRTLRFTVVVDGRKFTVNKVTHQSDLESWLDLYFDETRRMFKRAFRTTPRPLDASLRSAQELGGSWKTK